MISDPPSLASVKIPPSKSLPSIVDKLDFSLAIGLFLVKDLIGRFSAFFFVLLRETLDSRLVTGEALVSLFFLTCPLHVVNYRSVLADCHLWCCYLKFESLHGH